MRLGRQRRAIATCRCNVVLLDKTLYPRLSLANLQRQAWRVRHTPWKTTMTDKWNQRSSVPSSSRVTTQGSGKHNNGAEDAKNLWVRTGYQWKLKLCTYNARSLSSDDRLHELEDELDRINFDIVGICETRRTGEGCLTLNKSGHQFYYKGGNTHQNGIAFMVNKTLPATSRASKAFLTEWPNSPSRSTVNTISTLSRLIYQHQAIQMRKWTLSMRKLTTSSTTTKPTTTSLWVTSTPKLDRATRQNSVLVPTDWAHATPEVIP